MSKVNHLGLFTGILLDISDRKKLQSHILEIAADEQRRIGHELHDGTQQELTGLTLFAGTLCDYLESCTRTETNGAEAWMFEEQDLDKLKQTADRLLQGLKEANQHVHALSHGIMPVLIDAEQVAARPFDVSSQQPRLHYEEINRGHSGRTERRTLRQC